MHSQLRSLLLMGVLVLCASTVAVHGQGGLGSITGTVLDQTRGSLAGASIKVVETSTGSTRTATSNEAGLFNVPSLPPGTYKVTVSRQDFRSREVDSLT